MTKTWKIKGLDNAFVSGYTPEDLIERRIPADVYFLNSEAGNFAYSADFAEGSWAPPISLEVGSVPPFPSNALPEPLRWYVGELSRATQTPPILAAGVALGAVSIALAKKVVVEPRPGWVEPLVLWILTLLPSGERKTAVMNALRKPLDEWERDKRTELAPQIAEAEARRGILAQRKKNLEKQAAKEGDPVAMGLAVEAAQQLAQLEVPSLPQLTTSDTTQEAIAILLMQNDGRVGIWSDEGETVKVIAGRYSKDQSPSVELYLKGHAGGYYSSSRVGREGISLQDPAVPMVLSIQPGVIQGLSNQRMLHEQGFFARYLYALPHSALGNRESKPDPVDEEARKAYDGLVKSMLEIPTPRDEYGQVTPHVLRFCEQADELLEDLQDWVEPQLGSSGEMRSMREWGSKFAGQVVRIAGELHAADRVATGEEEPWATPLERPTLKRAIEIGLCYLEHTRATMGEMGADPRLNAARHLLDVLKRDNEARISKRDLFNKVRGDSRFNTMEDLDPIIEVLKDHGYARELTPKRRGAGRPRSPVLEINPLPPGPPPQNPQNPHNPQNTTSRGTKPFFEWLEDRRGPEDPPPSPGPPGPRDPGPDPTPEGPPEDTDPSPKRDAPGGDEKGYDRDKGTPFPEHEAAKGYELVSDPTGLSKVISDLEGTPEVGLDLETTGLRWWEDRIRIVSLTTESGRTWLVDAFKVNIHPLFSTLGKTKIVAHNALFDLLFLRRAGFEPEECACTMVLSQIIWAGKLKPGTDKNVEHDLASVAKRALGEHLDKGEQTADWSGSLTPKMLDYAARDSKVLLPLYSELMRRTQDIKEAS